MLKLTIFSSKTGYINVYKKENKKTECVMRSTNKILDNLNNLLIFTYEVEKLYVEAYKSVTDTTLKLFFKERAYERNEFGNALRTEIEKLNGTPKLLDNFSKNFYRIKTDIKNAILMHNEDDLFEEILDLKRETIDKYNELLMQMNLPLHLCKTLIKQRDNVQTSIRTLKRERVFVAYA